MAVMRFDKFTFKAQEAIQQAQKLAEERQHQAIEVEHLLSALVEQQEGVVQPILSKMDVNPGQLAAR
jgi:ATP-dependent Clp protease ATP-binding subunit ClpB